MMTPFLRILIELHAPDRPAKPTPGMLQREIDSIHARFSQRREEMAPGPDRFGFCDDTRQYAGEEGFR